VQTPQTIKYRQWNNKTIVPTKNITDLFTYLNIKLNKNQIANGSLLNFKVTTENDLLMFGKLIK
jgi:2-C-methyl-D-erythritol 4-phosphate cytidylyltransferase